jgi:hypothetical protein
MAEGTSDTYLESLLDLFRVWLIGVDGIDGIVARSLNTTDANGMLGISPDDWAPLDVEMTGDSPFEPTVQRYTISLQHIVKHANEEEGQRIHREVAKALRLMLYRDPNFQVSLRGLFVREGTRKERTQRFFITDQRYAANQTGTTTFLYMSVTNIAVETEIVTTS